MTALSATERARVELHGGAQCLRAAGVTLAIEGDFCRDDRIAEQRWDVRALNYAAGRLNAALTEAREEGKRDEALQAVIVGNKETLERMRAEAFARGREVGLEEAAQLLDLNAQIELLKPTRHISVRESKILSAAAIRALRHAAPEKDGNE